MNWKRALSAAPRYRVMVTPEPRLISDIYRYIRDRAPRAATQWSVSARASIKTLSHFPERCPLAPEAPTSTCNPSDVLGAGIAEPIEFCL